MKIISWNIRGMGSRSKRRVIKEKILTSKADVVILQETRKEVIHRKLIGTRYTDWVSLPYFGSSGGILVMWKTKSISVMEAVIEIFSVSIKIQAINGQDWWLSGVYGPNKVRDKDDFWEELAGLYGLCGPRWCVGGDFNVVRFPSEKSNGGRMTRSMRVFNNFLQDTNMRDPNLLNAEFTWSNLREEAVCCRLDRFIFTLEWEELFTNARQKILVRVTSDHCPIELDTSKLKWGPCPFWFENIWLNHPDFREKFKEWWKQEDFQGWEGFKFMKKLKFLKGKVKQWSKEEFQELGK
ncbi:hypothetical protein M0R45_009426 [Rubus argutus]|uniref:Endonuclease/exonuclease/phosphatase domain-containing protein n=1 Tax=Rubus argutus TaxID=59490 RepID=A0AAW1Y6Z4_RUBAR